MIFFLVLLKTKAVLTSTHNLYFGANIREIGKPLHIPVLLLKSGVYGVFNKRTSYLGVWFYRKQRPVKADIYPA